MQSPASADKIDLAGPDPPRYSPRPLVGRGSADPFRLSAWQRSVAGALTLVAGGMLGVAAWLTPNPDGFGTHRQLGLPPCTIVQVFGRRCPSCGMTTAWSRVVRGQLVRAMQSNAGGTLLALLAVATVPWAGAACCRGRWWPGLPGERTWLALGLLVFAVTLIDWTVRWFLFG